MITKNDIIDAAKQILRSRGRFKESRLITPERDWFIGLGIATLVLVGGGAYAGTLYFSVISFDAEVGSMEAQIVEYDQEKVVQALERYRDRRDNFNAVVGTATGTSALSGTSTAATTTEALLEEGVTDEEAEADVRAEPPAGTGLTGPLEAE